MVDEGGKRVNAIHRNELRKTIENEPLLALYLYTPLCGTCQLARRLLVIIEQLFPTLPFYETDINYIPKQAVEWQISSVPCLLLFVDGAMAGKWYAFPSVTDLYEQLQARLPR
ncbi:thioredoxin [Geobacillus sp. MMMUD3]|nr:thioredoxin [Geobacillus sp. MMMUD3]